MTNFIPIFPLDIIVYPNEPLNLHIFEPRYKQLIKECITTPKTFGIPVVLDKKVQEYGTVIEILELVKEYPGGEMDIRAKGTHIFRVLEIIREIPDKLYSGAIVNYPENITQPDDSKLSNLIMSEVKRLYSLLNVEEKLPPADGGILSYKIAHYIGLSPLQEYELMQLLIETQRLEYIRKHLNNMVPMLQGLEQAKARIKLNGHFRNLSSDNTEF
jgi:Lon protease-like protein